MTIYLLVDWLIDWYWCGWEEKEGWMRFIMILESHYNRTRQPAFLLSEHVGTYMWRFHEACEASLSRKMVWNLKFLLEKIDTSVDRLSQSPSLPFSFFAATQGGGMLYYSNIVCVNDKWHRRTKNRRLSMQHVAYCSLLVSWSLDSRSLWCCLDESCRSI